jgi:acetyl-CoA C-acetyltransferase
MVKVYIKGVGMTKFDYTQKFWWQFAYEAALDALENAKMKISDIDAILLSAISSAAGPESEHQVHKASMLSDVFKTNVPIVEVPAVCAGGGVAFWLASHLISNFKNILVLSGERLVESITEVTTDRILAASERILEQPEGLIFPVQKAMVWQQYMQKYGGTMEDLALVALKNHQNAVSNPKAYFYQRPVSIEEIRNSPVIASPFRLYDCSLSINGGAAVIISQEKTDVELVGSGFATDYMLASLRKDMTHYLATQMAAKNAYEQAGISPEDVDVAEVHDAFTSEEIIAYEDLGFAQVGKGPELIKKGITNINGKIPVNASGGLKAKGHPISVTGLAQIYEITNQLRGKCGERQVKGAKIGLTHNLGGNGGTVVVYIFKKVS